MKIIFLTLASIAVLIADPSEKSYRRSLARGEVALSGIPRENQAFKNALSVASAYFNKHAAGERDVTIIQTLDDTTALGSFGSGSTSRVVAISGMTKRVSDGTVISCHFEKTGQLKDYIDVLGALRTVDVFKIVTPPSGPKYDADASLAKLMKGETIEIEQSKAIVNCKNCLATGRVARTKNDPRAKDGKAKCPVCDGLGKVLEVKLVTIKW